MLDLADPPAPFDFGEALQRVSGARGQEPKRPRGTSTEAYTARGADLGRADYPASPGGTSTEGRTSLSAIEAALGIDGWTCGLPGHDGGAAWIGDYSGGPQYACDCLGWSEPRAKAHDGFAPMWHFPLGDSYRARWTGKAIGQRSTLPAGLRWAWWLLLEHDAGLRVPVTVELPAAAGEVDERVAGFAALMFGLRLSHGRDLEMPFAVRFVEERLRISRNTANRAITRLVDAGVLVISGHEPSRCGKPTPVYVPGGPR